MPGSTDDYDSPWKSAIEHALPECIAFYFPEAHRKIDWRRGHSFLDKELRQVTRSAESGRRHVDKLVRVHQHDGREDWVYIHIEIQGQHDNDFAKRMFVYNYRIFDRYDRPVASLAVLADNDRDWRPAHFGFELFGCRHHLDFPIAKLADHEISHDELAHNSNPFALVTAAHLQTHRTRNKPIDRFEAKRNLIRLLYQHDWNKSRILQFFSVLDWMMRLPEELELKLWHDIETIEGERNVKYVTSVERLANERGMQQGMQEGLEKGLEKGMQKGMQKGLETGLAKGRAEGGSALLGRMLNRRFGPLPKSIIDRLAHATPDQLEIWADRVLEADKLDDVFAEN